MAKNYFKHDFGARNDVKLTNLLAELGYKGYGVYWALLEYLYENNGEIPEESIQNISKTLRVSFKFCRKVIENYSLFEKIGSTYVSIRAQNELKSMGEKSVKARESALNRWQDGCERIATPNANAMLKKEKRREEREDKSKPDTFVSDHYSFVQSLMSNILWLNQAGKMLSVTSPEYMRQLMTEFNQHLATSFETKKSEKDFASHFVNWARLVLQDRRKGNNNPESAPLN